MKRYMLQIGPGGEPEMIETPAGAWVHVTDMQAQHEHAVAAIARLLRVHENRGDEMSIVLAQQILAAQSQ